MLRPALPALALLALLMAAAPASAQTACVGGLAGAYPCDRIDLLAHFTPQELGAPQEGACPEPYPGLCANDLWGWQDPETGRQYALVGLATGTAFVDVTIRTAPLRLGMMPTATVGSSWRDVKALGHVALVVSEAPDHGIQVFDLRRLRGLTEDPSRIFDADTRYLGIRSAHNIVVNETSRMAYAVGSRVASNEFPASCLPRGFHAVDFSDPLAPIFAGCFSDQENGVDGGYTHDAQCVTYDGPDADYAGREICFGSNTDEVTVFDATDPAAAVVVSQVQYPTPAYTHQGWLTEDSRYLLVNDELDEVNAASSGIVMPQRTLVFDVSDLDNPEFAFSYLSDIETIDHNLYVVGDLAFESNYEAGLRVLDLSRIEEGMLEEVAFFDTYPLGTSVNFAGQWSNYPFFGDGLVLANDGETGFYVLQVDPLLVTSASGNVPTEAGVTLSEARPNPAAHTAHLTLRVDAAQSVRADMFDVAGRRVASVFEGAVSPGADLELTVVGDRLPAGVYVVRVTGETFETSRRVVLTR